MKVVICGPNLNDQRHGTFHVHAAGCSDIGHYGRNRSMGGEEPWEVEASSWEGVMLHVYGPDAGSFDLDPGDRDSVDEYVGDFYFLPCTQPGLLRYESEAKEAAELAEAYVNDPENDCDICGEGRDYCLGHGELNGRTDEDMEEAIGLANLGTDGTRWNDLPVWAREKYVREAMRMTAENRAISEAEFGPVEES